MNDSEGPEFQQVCSSPLVSHYGITYIPLVRGSAHLPSLVLTMCS